MNLLPMLLIILASGIVQGTVGFGFSMVAVPLLSIFMPLPKIVPMLILAGLSMNALIVYKLKKDVNIKRMKWLLVAGMCSTPLGATLLTVLDANVLKLIVGAVIVFSAVIMYKGYKVNFKSELKANLIAGILSGLLNGSLSLSGPPIIFFLNNQGANKQEFRANLAIYFLSLNIFTSLTFLYKGLFTSEVVMLSVFSIPVVLLSTAIGVMVGNKVEEKIFKTITIMGIGIMGIISVINGAMATI